MNLLLSLVLVTLSPANAVSLPAAMNEFDSIGDVEETTVSSLKKVSADELPTLAPEGDLAEFKQGLERQVVRCREMDIEAVFLFGTRKVSRKQWCIQTSQAFLALAAESADMVELLAKAKTKFEWYKTTGTDGNGTVAFTGYYSPTLNGSREPDGKATYPLYQRPSDLVQIVVDGKTVWRKKLPNGSYDFYDDRSMIDMDGTLKGKNLEIAYVDDIFSAYILQVQGSGSVLLREKDGSTKRILTNYAASNGRPYVSLRRILMEQGVEEKYLTIPGMRIYFREHPEKLIPNLNKNPSYVFFQENPTGPFGSLGTILANGHSVAVDPKHIPLGSVAFLKTQRPDIVAGEVTAWKDFSRLMLAQDTGGAIQGAGRVDIYWGEDEYAEIAAGTLNHTGELYLAVVPPRDSH